MFGSCISTHRTQIIWPAIASMLLVQCGSPEATSTEGTAAPEATTASVALPAKGPVMLVDLLAFYAQPSGKEQVILPWPIVDANAAPDAPIHWKTAERVSGEEGSILRGTVRVSIPKGTEIDEPAMEWDLLLVGTEQGYSRIEMAHFNTQEATANDAASLLGPIGGTARLVQKCDDDLMSGFYRYELDLPGRAVAWFRIGWSAGSEGMGRTVSLMLSPADGKKKEECFSEGM